MLEIPSKLMISPPNILNSEYGYIFRDHPEIFTSVGCEVLLFIIRCYIFML